MIAQKRAENLQQTAIAVTAISEYAYGVNLADKYYHTDATDQAPITQYVTPGAPREIGAGFKVNFGN